MSRIKFCEEMDKGKLGKVLSVYCPSDHTDGVPVVFFNDTLLGFGADGVLICSKSLLIKQPFQAVETIYWRDIRDIKYIKGSLFINNEIRVKLVMVDHAEAEENFGFAAEYFLTPVPANDIVSTAALKSTKVKTAYNFSTDEKNCNPEYSVSNKNFDLAEFYLSKKINESESNDIEIWHHIYNLFILIKQLASEIPIHESIKELESVSHFLVQDILIDLAAFVYVSLEAQGLRREQIMLYAQFPLVLSKIFYNATNSSTSGKKFTSVTTRETDCKRFWRFFEYQLSVKRNNKKSGKLIIENLYIFLSRDGGKKAFKSCLLVLEDKTYHDYLESLIIDLESAYESMIVDFYNKSFQPWVMLEDVPPYSFNAKLADDIEDRDN